MQFSPSPIPLVLRDKFHPEILTGPSDLGVKKRWVRENRFMRQYRENRTRLPKLIIND